MRAPSSVENSENATSTPSPDSNSIRPASVSARAAGCGLAWSGRSPCIFVALRVIGCEFRMQAQPVRPRSLESAA